MLKKLLLLALVAISAVSATAQNQNLTFLGQKTYTNELSDVWGYVAPDGKEYALVGVYNGVSIVDVTNPTTPTEKAFIPGPTSTWRDIKTWGNYAYVTNEKAGGLQIINLSYLPDSVQVTSWYGNNGVTFSKAHNIWIDESGYAYIFGANYGIGGAIIADLTNPTSPNVKTVYNHGYIHDGFVRGDTMWAAEIYNGYFSMVDVSNKTVAPLPVSTIMGTHSTPDNFTHNIWPTDDNNYTFTTDEVSGAFIAAYNTSDPSNISEVDRVRSSPGSGVIPHNAIYYDGYIITSYYRDGVTIHDAARPNNLIQTGRYDSSPLAGNGFNGVWGVYPFLPSGNILATDIEQGLFILAPNYQRGAYLEGVVTDSVSGLVLNNVKVQINGFPIADATTSLIGKYATGLADSGTYSVTFSKPGFETKTISNVTIDNGVVATLDVQLVQLPFFTYAGQVVDSITGVGIPGAIVLVENSDFTYNATTDQNGSFSIPGVYFDSYQIYSGKWGYQSKYIGNQLLNNSLFPLLVELSKDYYDDFFFDFNWSVNTSASSGAWVKDSPIATSFNGSLANPGNDLNNDIGDEAYVTGNGGGAGGSDDVDNGRTVLTSPVFDATLYVDPYVSYYRWFYNGGGGSTPNDSLIVRLMNGIDTVVIDFITNGDTQESQWVYKNIKISDFIQPTANMQISFDAADLPPDGHIVEAGVDLFRVIEMSNIAPSANFTADITAGCAPLTIQFQDQSSANPHTWIWELPGADDTISTAANPVVVYSNPGTYNVQLKVYNTNGSDSMTQVAFITVYDSPEVTATATATSAGQSNGTATATVNGGIPPYMFYWNDPQQQTGSTATDLGAGTYTVTVEDANGCEDTVSVTVQINTGIYSPDEIVVSVYPNPFNDYFEIDYDLTAIDFSTSSLELIDITGRVIIKKDLVSAGKIKITSIDHSGIYFVRIKSHNKILWQEKVIKL